jgi:hypothetical protein
MWKQKGKMLFLVLACLCFSLIIGSTHKAYASTGIDPAMSFEGKVNTASGINIPDGTYNMEFKIYSGGTSTGGGTLLWTEDYLVGSSEGGITFNGGTFAANLGSVCAFSGGSCETYTNTGINWNVYPLYLSLQIGNTSSCTVTTNFNSNCSGDGEMSPYIMMTSNPYSYNSSLLGGLSSTAFSQLSAANLFQPSLTAGNVTGVTVAQTLASSPTADIFDVDSYASSTNTPVLQVTSGAGINLYGGSSASINIGSQSSANTVNIGDSGSTTNTDNVNIDNTSGSNTSAISVGGALQSGTITLGQSTANNTINIGAAALSANTQTINIGSGATGSGTDNITIGSSANGTTTIQSPSVQIGSASTSNTTQSLLQLNSVNTLAEAAGCSTSSNQGSMYYNTNTNTIRSCVAGSWQDIVTTQDLALQLFGVVPDSGTNPGDLLGATATSTSASNTGGPCKVGYDGTGSVYVNSCQAYSGGRLVNVAAATISLSGIASASYQNICLNSSGVPGLVGTAATSMAATPFNNLSSSSTTTLGQPLLCLATVETGSASTLAAIYDTRTFTNTQKTYISTPTGVILGGLVEVYTTGALAYSISAGYPIAGIAVAYTGSSSSSGATNAIIATSGPQWVTSQSGTLQDFLSPTANAGIAKGNVTSGSALYQIAGIVMTPYESSCTTQQYNSSNCNESIYTILNIH